MSIREDGGLLFMVSQTSKGRLEVVAVGEGWSLAACLAPSMGEPEALGGGAAGGPSSSSSKFKYLKSQKNAKVEYSRI